MSMTRIVGLAIAALIGIGLVAFVVIQFVPVERTNPPVVREPNWDSSQTRALMERACFDCHSNETKWPWYTKVAPASWAIARDVQEGRRELNYSEWYPDEENESLEAIQEGAMPPRQYLLMHPEARLSDAEMQTLVTGLKATFGNTLEDDEEFGESEIHENEDDDDERYEGDEEGD